MSDVKYISGIFTGEYAIHPLSNERLPIWISDYILAGYGNCADIGVPCGEQMDCNFTKFVQIKIRNDFLAKEL